MLYRIAHIIAYVFHPLILPTYAFFLLLTFGPGLSVYLATGEALYILARVFINTFAFPVIILLFMRKLGFITDFKLPAARDRILPYIAISACVMWTFVSFYKSDYPPLLYQALLGASLTTFLLFFVNIFLKVSIHTAAAGCFTIIFLYLSFTSGYELKLGAMLVMIMAGIIGSSRLLLKAHEPVEVYAGYLIGILSQLIAFKF